LDRYRRRYPPDVSVSVRRGLLLAAFFGLWLVLVGTLSGGELVAGAVAATSATVVCEVVVAAGLLPFPGSARSWASARFVPVRIAADTGRLLAALAHGRSGRFRVAELPRGRHWHRHAERGIGALVASVAPNTIVVDIDAERRRALRHELSPRDEDPLE
jgi:hypothetical protein